jgi:hypothetical protein
MQQAIRIFETAFAKAFGVVFGAVAVYGALFLLVVLLAAPVYFVLRRRVSGRVDLRFGAAPRDTLQFYDSPPDTGEAFGGTAPAAIAPAASTGDVGRDEFLRDLDAFDRGYGHG